MSNEVIQQATAEAPVAGDYFLQWAATATKGSDARKCTGTQLGALMKQIVPQALVLKVGDETTDLTTGTAKHTFRMPYAFRLTEVRANVNTAPVGSTLDVDINDGGTTILPTKLTIDASEKTSTTAAAAAVLAGIAQVETVTCRADASDDLDGRYFVLYDSAGSVGVWFDVDDSGTTIPAGAAAADRAIEVTGVATDDTAADVATAVASALDGDSEFSASSDSAVVTVTQATAGAVTAGSDGDSLVEVAVVTTGEAGVVNLADDAEITIDIDQIGSSTAGKGLKVTLIGVQQA